VPQAFVAISAPIFRKTSVIEGQPTETRLRSRVLSAGCHPRLLSVDHTPPAYET
jgi:hypothetical protein